MNKEIKSILWKCRRVFRWSKKLTNDSFHDKFYEKNGKSVNREYLRLHTKFKIPYDVTSEADYGFVTQNHKKRNIPIQISGKTIKAMRELQVDNQPCLAYGTSKISIYISAKAMDMVGSDAVAFSGIPPKDDGTKSSKKRKRQGRIQVWSPKKRPKPVFRLIKYLQRFKDDVVPLEVICPATVFPFEKPPSSYSSTVEMNMIYSGLYQHLYPASAGRPLTRPIITELNRALIENWVGWYKDYPSTEAWPYILWKNEELLPYPLRLDSVTKILGANPSVSFLHELQQENKNFKLHEFSEAVREAQHHVDFRMMKKFGLTKTVLRNGISYEAPFLTSKILALAVYKYRPECCSKIVGDDEEEKDESFSSTSSSSSSSSPSSDMEEEESNGVSVVEDSIEPVDDDGTRDIFSGIPVYKHSRQELATWTSVWTEEGKTADVSMFSLACQPEILKENQDFGEELLEHRRELAQGLKNELLILEKAIKQTERGLCHIAQEKEYYAARKKEDDDELKAVDELKQNFKNYFGEQMDSITRFVMSQTDEESGRAWIDKSFGDFGSIFSILPLPPLPTNKSSLLPRLLTVTKTKQSATHTFLKDVCDSNTLNQMIGTGRSTDHDYQYEDNDSDSDQEAKD